MGLGAKGVSLSLIAPAEEKSHGKIVRALQGAKFSKILLDGRLLSSAQERVNLASKVVVAAQKEHQIQSQNQWFLEKAKEADLELDEDLLEEDSANAADRNDIRQAQAARVRLAQLLTEPMTTQRFGKFLSTHSAARHEEIQPMVGSAAASKSLLGKMKRGKGGGHRPKKRSRMK